MVLFPNAKINIGLYVTAKRPDGYHDIATVMVPVGWHDVLEMVPNRSGSASLTVSGRQVDCPPEKNLVMKAYQALSAEIGGLPPVDFYLEKIIPDGAGLGGGSADAAFALKGLNEMFNIGLSDGQLARIAASVGADCAFFIYNRPALCTGIGDIIRPIECDSLVDKAILIAKPCVASVSTKEAYASIIPQQIKLDLEGELAKDPVNWDVSNDFELPVSMRLPEISRLKQFLVDNGAVYASMTGSGAAVYGVFDTDKMAQDVAGRLSECDKIVTHIL